MRYKRDTTGRFDQRPHFDPEEIENLCQKALSDYIGKTIGSVQYPISTDILTKFIESLAEDLDLFTDMSEHKLADGVEGFTEYSFNNKPSVYINQRLSLLHYMKTRLRTTLSHEAGHVILHGPLFKEDSQCRLLRSTEEWARPSPTTIAQRAASRDWMEWQANYAMGALLMPKDAVNELASWYGQKYGFHPPFQFNIRRDLNGLNIGKRTFIQYVHHICCKLPMKIICERYEPILRYFPKECEWVIELGKEACNCAICTWSRRIAAWLNLVINTC